MTINRETRRRVFGVAGAGAVAMAVAACSATSATASSTATQVLLDIQGGIGTLKVVVAEAGSYLSAATASAVNAALTSASNAFAALTSALANVGTASTLQTIEGYLSAGVGAVVAALTGVPGAAAYLAIAQTVAALLPAITAWIDSILVSASPAPAIAPRDFGPIRSKLGIPSLSS